MEYLIKVCTSSIFSPLLPSSLSPPTPLLSPSNYLLFPTTPLLSPTALFYPPSLPVYASLLYVIPSLLSIRRKVNSSVGLQPITSRSLYQCLLMLIAQSSKPLRAIVNMLQILIQWCGPLNLSPLVHYVNS